MQQPLVSIITPAYNAKRFITETIDSVLQQTYKNYEMIIVDDCSKDDTYLFIQQYVADKPKIRVYQVEQNGGAAKARNFGIQQAKGKYLAFLDADDLWAPKKLEKQVAFMEKYDYDFTFTNYEMIDEDGQKVDRQVLCPSVVTYKQLLKNTTIGCLTVMLNIEKLGQVQMPNLQPEDTALWLKILNKDIQAHCLQEVLACYRLVGNSASSNKMKVAKKMWIVYRQSENIPAWRAAWYFTHYAMNAVKKHYL